MSNPSDLPSDARLPQDPSLKAIEAELLESYQRCQDNKGALVSRENAGFVEALWHAIDTSELLPDFELLSEVQHGAIGEDFRSSINKLMDALREGHSLPQSPSLDPWSYLIAEHRRLKAGNSVTENDIIRARKISSFLNSYINRSEVSTARAAVADGTAQIRQHILDYKSIEEVANGIKIIEKVGSGSQAMAYRGHDTGLDRPVFIKEFTNAGAGFKDDPKADRAIVEAKNLAKLNHPNIVTVHQVIKTRENRVYIVEEFVEGTTLRSEIDTKGFLSEEDVLKIAIPLAKSLEHSHGMGILHRDLNPSNVLISSDAVVKLCDFGISRALRGGRADATEEGIFVGTAEFASPEQARALQLDARSDQFSFGALLYFMATGESPHPANGQDMKDTLLDVRKSGAIPLTEMLPGFNKDLSAVIFQTLEKDPDNRFPSMKETREALEAVRDGRPVALVPRSSRGRAAKWGLAAIAAVLLLIVAWAVTSSLGSPDPEHGTRTEEAARKANLPEPEPKNTEDEEKSERPKKDEGGRKVADENGQSQVPVIMPYLPEPSEILLSDPVQMVTTQAYFSRLKVEGADQKQILDLFLLYESLDERIRQHRYEEPIQALRAFRQENLGEFADYLAEFALRRVLLVKTVYEATTFTVGETVTVVMAGPAGEKRMFTGKLLSKSAGELRLMPISTDVAVTLPMERLHPETYVLDAAPLDRILFLATHGQSTEAAKLLFDHLAKDHSDYHPELLPHAPGILLATALGTLRPLLGGNAKPAKELLSIVDANKDRLPASLNDLAEVDRILEFELAAAELFHAKNYSEVLTHCPESRFVLPSARKLQSHFREEATLDRLLRSETLAWTRRPSNKLRAHRIKLTNRDSGEKRWSYMLTVRGDEEQRIERDLPEAKTGMRLYLGFVPKGKGARFAISLGQSEAGDDFQVVYQDGEFGLEKRSKKTDKPVVLQARKYANLPDDMNLTIIRTSGLLVVMLDTELLFFAENPNTIRHLVSVSTRDSDLLLHEAWFIGER